LLELRPRFGLELVRDRAAAGGLLTSDGTVYPLLLNRLRNAGLVTSQWRAGRAIARKNGLSAGSEMFAWMLDGSGRDQAAATLGSLPPPLPALPDGLEASFRQDPALVTAAWPVRVQSVPARWSIEPAIAGSMEHRAGDPTSRTGPISPMTRASGPGATTRSPRPDGST
jgi:Transcriptional regulator PadR-like family